MRAKQILALVVLLLVAFLIVYPPLANGNVKIAASSSSPVDVEHLYLTISEISAHRTDTREPSGWFTVTNQSSRIDLASVNSTQTIGLGSVSVGQYDMVRVRITNATAVANSTSKRVQLPSTVFTIPVSFLVQLGPQTVVRLKIVPDVQETPEVITLRLSFTAIQENHAP